MDKAHGIAKRELLLIALIIGMVVLVIAALQRPVTKYQNAMNASVQAEARLVLARILVAEAKTPGIFETDLAKLEEGRMLFGTGDCSKDFGAMCAADTQDTCLSLEGIEVNAQDRKPFSPAVPGYYAELRDDALVVGACAPFGGEPAEVYTERF
jgi:hypothetical protein